MENNENEILEEKKDVPVNPTLTSNIENKPKKKKKNAFAIILILLFLCVAGVGGYLFFFSKPTEPTTIDNDTKDVKSEYRMSGNSLENFDLAFLKLENEAKNKVYSPLSIKYALEMLAEGADGESKAQLDAIIGDYVAKKYTNSEHMSFANAMFVKNTFKEAIKKDYTNNLSTKYNAEIIFDTFENAKNINDWVSNKTFNLINNLLDDDISGNDFFLINALAIDMNWKNQIHCASGSMERVPCVDNGIYNITYDHEKIEDDDKWAYGITEYPYFDESDFYHLNFNGQEKTKASKILADFNRYDIIKEVGEENIRKTITEEYKKWVETDEAKSLIKYDASYADVEKNVNKYIEEIKANYGKSKISTDFSLYNDDNVIAFAKDLQEYDGVKLQYIGIMPKEKELTTYINDISKEDINKVISNLKELKIENFKDGVATIIRGDIPLFKFEYELKLMNDLKKLGIEDIFDINKANLSKMTDNTEVIDKAVHKANIEFSNEGIKAAAATAMGGAGATGGGFEYLYKIPVERIDITFNKPYMYIIRDKDSGEVWFTGTVYEPIKK